MTQSNKKEMIFIFTGPNGAGRRTVSEMSGSTLDMRQVISYTTRSPRPSEVEGRDYFFISRDQFEVSRTNNEFIEVVEIDKNLYGVKGADIERMLRSHRAIYLVLNSEGAETLKKLYGERAVRICIYAERDLLLKRQKDRGDSNEQIDRYMSHYEQEMNYMPNCEYSIENVDLAHTVFDLTKILENYLDRDLLDLD